MHIDQKLFVDADHTHPDYQFRATEVKTFGRSDGWFATHPQLGCGKTYPTQFEAVRHLFEDHACTNVRLADADLVHTLERKRRG
jgi:hypothetical protein